jgi:thioredoxin
MKRFLLSLIVIVPFFFSDCKADNKESSKSAAVAEGPVTILTNDSFKKLIFNYDVNKEWKYAGNKPAIIDFYADWCAPCRQLSPIVEQIAKEYEGKIVVYKVDTEKEINLSQNLGITGLPTLLFIPVEGKPQVTMGALPKESLVQAIEEILKVR